MADYKGAAAALRDAFYDAVRRDAEISYKTGIINDGRGDYPLVSGIASKTGRMAGRMIADELARAFSGGNVPLDAARQYMFPTLRSNHEFIASLAQKVQETINERSGIGLAAMRAEFNESRVYNLAQLISENGARSIDSLADYADGLAGLVVGDTKRIQMQVEHLPDYTENMSLSTVDDTVRGNADFQYNAGLQPMIIRRGGGGCCAWCANLVGEYQYSEIKNGDTDVFRRHRCCRCTVEYDPGTGMVQNVHTKVWR